jgi:hypothetical protein
MRSCMYILSLVCLIALTASAVQAEVPAMMNYQGYLTDAVDTPLNETVDMEFNLYQEESGGTPLWTETQNGIVVSEGIFNVILGGSVPLDLPFDVPYYLGIRINGEEMTPRKPLLSMPYALNAKPTAPAVPAPGSYMSGLVSISPFENCIQTAGAHLPKMECEKRTLLTVAVARGTYVGLEGTFQREVENNGDDDSTSYMEEIAAAITLTRQGDAIECAIEYDTATTTFTLSPAAPLYDGPTNGLPVDATGRLLSDSLVELTVPLNPASLRQIIPESSATCTASASSLGTHHAQMTVEVVNTGDLSSVYLVTVPVCNACDDLIPAQSTTLDSGESAMFTFTLYSADGFTTGDTCVIELRSPTGRLFDKQTITLQ